MTEEMINIPAPDGMANAYAYTPTGKGPWPGAIFFMDAIGIRPAMKQMAQRLASLGYFVILPNLYYRDGKIENMDLEKDRDKFMGLASLVYQGKAIADMGAYIEYLSRNKNVKGSPLGCTGYCMGARAALIAAGQFPDRIGAAACFHGARLASDDADSPHRRAHAMKGQIYVGVAEIDPWLAPNETDRLKGALEGAAVTHDVEIYPGVEHGFAVPGIPPFNEAAAERHWDRLAGLFRKAL